MRVTKAGVAKAVTLLIGPTCANVRARASRSCASEYTRSTSEGRVLCVKLGSKLWKIGSISTILTRLRTRTSGNVIVLTLDVSRSSTCLTVAKSGGFGTIASSSLMQNFRSKHSLQATMKDTSTKTFQFRVQG
eukprot:6184040-Pleurochrysis_carterae.AAC.6